MMFTEDFEPWLRWCVWGVVLAEGHPGRWPCLGAAGLHRKASVAWPVAAEES